MANELVHCLLLAANLVAWHVSHQVKGHQTACFRMSCMELSGCQSALTIAPTASPSHGYAHGEKQRTAN